MADELKEQIVKGDVCWLEISIDSKPGKGLDIWVRGVPEIEAFIKSLGNGGKDAVEAYDKQWSSYSPDKPLSIYRIDNDLPESNGYTITNPGGVIRTSDKLGRGTVNLSFLRVAGLSSPEGIRFYVKGVYSRPYTEHVADEILKHSRRFVKDYIVGTSVNLRISSQLV